MDDEEEDEHSWEEISLSSGLILVESYSPEKSRRNYPDCRENWESNERDVVVLERCLRCDQAVERDELGREVHRSVGAEEEVSHLLGPLHFEGGYQHQDL